MTTLFACKSVFVVVQLIIYSKFLAPALPNFVHNADIGIYIMCVLLRKAIIYYPSCRLLQQRFLIISRRRGRRCFPRVSLSEINIFLLKNI